MKDKIKQALIKMLDMGEFEKMKKFYTHDAQRIESDEFVAKQLKEHDIPIIPLLMSIRSTETFRDLLTFMMNMED